MRLRAGLRFGEGEAADGATTGQFSQPLVLLRLRAVIQHRAAAHRIVDAHQRAGGAVAGGDFFHGQGVGHVVDIAAAPFFRDDHAEQAKLAHLGDQSVVDPAGLFPGLCMGGDLAAGEVARHVADHALVFAEFEVMHCAVSSCCCAAKELQAVALRRVLPVVALKPSKNAWTRSGVTSASVGGFQRGDLSLSMISARTPSMMSPLANH